MNETTISSENLRIMVIGGNGAGKSTFSAQLSRQLGIRCIHLDKLFRTSDGTLRPRDIVNKELCSLYLDSPWIIDGNYSDTWQDRSQSADLIIFLNIEKEQRIKNLEHRAASNKVLDDGSLKYLDEDFRTYARSYEERGKNKALALVQSNADKSLILHTWSHQTVYILKSSLSKNSDIKLVLADFSRAIDS